MMSTQINLWVFFSKKILETVNLLIFALDIAKGMEHVGDLGIVHRDLALRNCM